MVQLQSQHSKQSRIGKQKHDQPTWRGQPAPALVGDDHEAVILA
jgi:hypothetical protein